MNPALDGKTIRIPGYVLPLEFSGSKVTEFLLVPWVGACIHTPPPEPNQIVYVKARQGLRHPAHVRRRVGHGPHSRDREQEVGANRRRVGRYRRRVFARARASWSPIRVGWALLPVSGLVALAESRPIMTDRDPALKHSRTERGHLCLLLWMEPIRVPGQCRPRASEGRWGRYGCE